MKNKCWKYGSTPCKKPGDCKIHYMCVGRSKKKHHKINPNPGPHSWRGERYWPVTFCGLELHKIVDIRKLSEKERKEYFLAIAQPGRMPAPSLDPAYTVYFQRGWDAREILVATNNPTCNKCNGK